MNLAKLAMSNWTVNTSQGMTLAQAFGVSKGTVSFPGISAQLPVGQAAANQASLNPPGTNESPTQSAGSPPTSLTANMQLGQTMAAAQPYNWTGAQWTALLQLWWDESKWVTNAENQGSGAYGIPQALPASKMASAGSDWETNPATQIAWGLLYILQTYGNPVNALNHENAYGWY
jgi:resuscitation-promoting factor RpfB